MNDGTRWGRTGSRAEMGKVRKMKMGHTIVDAGTGQGQSIVTGRGGNWRLDCAVPALDRLVSSPAFDHMITHLQQPSLGSSSPPCTIRPFPETAGVLISAVVKPAGNLDRPSWSSCSTDVRYRENGAGEGCIRIRTCSADTGLSPSSFVRLPLPLVWDTVMGTPRSVDELTSASCPALMSVIGIMPSSSSRGR